MRLPKTFRFAGERVFIRRMGSAVVLLPYQAGWDSLIESLELFSDDFLPQRDQPAPPC